MNDLNKMWEALATHQPIADKKGYGKEWARMCAERTWADAYDACRASSAVHAAANFEDICNAAYAADYASSSDVAPAAAARAIQYIEKANKEEA